MPLGYEVVPYSEWGGVMQGKHLDIEWDFFTSAYHPEDTIRDRVGVFLAMASRCVPEETYV